MPQASAPGPVRVDLPRLESPMLAAQPAVPASMQRVGEVSQAVARREKRGRLGGGRTRQGMTIHFSPNITVGGGGLNSGGDVRGQVQEGLKPSMRELEQMLRRLQTEQQRRAFLQMAIMTPVGNFGSGTVAQIIHELTRTRGGVSQRAAGRDHVRPHHLLRGMEASFSARPPSTR